MNPKVKRILEKILFAGFISIIVMIVPVFVLAILKYSVDKIFNNADLSDFLDHVYIFFLSLDVLMVFIVFYTLVLSDDKKKDKTQS